MFGGQNNAVEIGLADLETAMGTAAGSSLLVGAPSAGWLQSGQIVMGTYPHYDSVQIGYATALTDYATSGDTGLYPGSGATYEAINGFWTDYVPWYVVWPGVNNTNTNAVIEISQLNGYLLNSVNYSWQKLGAANGGQIATAQWMNTSTLAVTGSATAARQLGWPANSFTLNDGGTLRRLHGYGPRSNNTYGGAAVAAVAWGCKMRIVAPYGGALDGVVEYYGVAGLDCYPKGLALTTAPGGWVGFGGNTIPLAGPGYIPGVGCTKLHLLPTDGSRLRIMGATVEAAAVTTAKTYTGSRYSADSVFETHPLYTQQVAAL